jgi:DNA-binding PadR family transcriptional regulator
MAEAPNVCDMRGYLSFLILWSVKQRPRTGAEIALELEKRKGCRPNPGTLYPALKYLVQHHALLVRMEQNRKLYSLTPEGRRELLAAREAFVKAFYDVLTR